MKKVFKNCVAVGMAAGMLLGGIVVIPVDSNSVDTCTANLGSNGHMTCRLEGVGTGARGTTTLQGQGQVRSQITIRASANGPALSSATGAWSATSIANLTTGYSNGRQVQGVHSWRQSSNHGASVVRNTLIFRPAL